MSRPVGRKPRWLSLLAPHRIVPGAVVLLVLMAAGEDGKKGCKCKPEPEVVDVDSDTEVIVASVEVDLQVVSIDPSRAVAGERTSATLYGSGFEAGTVVNVGSVAAADVRRVDDSTLTLTLPSLTAGRYDVSARLPSGETAVLRRGLFVEEGGPQCTDLTVRFETNRETLTAQAQSAIDASLSCYTDRSDGIQIEGHADERGTTDYNLALGQRRADSVKRYLTGRGVPSSRMTVVSYGEERPEDSGHSESSWAANRRAEIRLGQ